MSLHAVKGKNSSEFIDIYASPDSDAKLPKYKMPDDSSDPRIIYSVVRDELLLDGNSRQNLATFCTTWVEDEVNS